MRIDLMTGAAVAFAGFAAWAYLKPRAASAPASNGAGGLVYTDPFALATAQKNASKAAQPQNTDYLTGIDWATPNAITGANLLTGGTTYQGIWQP